MPSRDGAGASRGGAGRFSHCLSHGPNRAPVGGMNRTAFAFLLAGFGLAFTRTASANVGDLCPTALLGQSCGNGDICVQATCCDDPNGCAFDAGSGSGSGSSGGSSGSSGAGSSSSSSGSGGGTGTSYECGICQLVFGTYCPPAEL